MQEVPVIPTCSRCELLMLSCIRTIFQEDKTEKEFHLTYHKVWLSSVFTHRQIVFSTCRRPYRLAARGSQTCREHASSHVTARVGPVHGGDFDKSEGEVINVMDLRNNITILL